MIADRKTLFETFGTTPLIQQIYEPVQYSPFLFRHLSEVAQKTLTTHAPDLVSMRLNPEQPEILALRILDFLSSKKDFIRRKAHNFRNEEYYGRAFPFITKAIQKSQPLEFSGLCVSANIPNPDLTGPSPYPHMGLYLACENIHKIAVGVQKIYQPGAKFFLGFESNLYGRLYFLSTETVKYSYDAARSINERAYELISKPHYMTSPVVIMDVQDMIEASFGSLATFENTVGKIKGQVTLMHEWTEWYEKTIPDMFFPSRKAKARFIEDMSRWRAAVNALKYMGGERGKGFVNFSPEVIPFTASGRRTNMLALQMIPRNDPLPHQRIMTYLPEKERWLLQSYETIKTSDREYVPHYVKEYTYPFFYKAV